MNPSALQSLAASTPSSDIDKAAAIMGKVLLDNYAGQAPDYNNVLSLISTSRTGAKTAMASDDGMGPMVSLDGYWFGFQMVVPEEVISEVMKALAGGGGAATASAALMAAVHTAIQYGMISAASGPAAPIAAVIFGCVAAYFGAQAGAATLLDKGNGLTWTFAWPTVVLGPAALLTIIPVPNSPVTFNHRSFDGGDQHTDTGILLLGHDGTAYAATMAGNTFTKVSTNTRTGVLDFVDSNGAKKFMRVHGKKFYVSDSKTMSNPQDLWDISYTVGTSGLKYTANIAW